MTGFQRWIVRCLLGVTIPVIISCSPIERLDEDDIDIARHKALIEDTSLSRTLLAPHKQPAAPLPQRRKLVSVLHHPHSFSHSGFLTALRSRIHHETDLTSPPAMQPEAELTAAPAAPWPSAYLEELEQIKSVLEEASDRLDQKQHEIDETAEQTPQILHPQLSQYHQPDLTQLKDNPILHFNSAAITLPQSLRMIEKITGAVFTLPEQPDVVNRPLAFDVTAPLSVILEQIAVRSELVLLAHNDSPSLFRFVTEQEFHQTLQQLHQTEKWHQQQHMRQSRQADIQTAQHALSDAHHHLAELIVATEAPEMPVRQLLFSQNPPVMLTQTMLEIEKISQKIAAKTAYLQLEQEQEQNQLAEHPRHDAGTLSAVYAEQLNSQDCIPLGQEIFIEDVSLYHQDSEELIQHLKQILHFDIPAQIDDTPPDIQANSQTDASEQISDDDADDSQSQSRCTSPLLQHRLRLIPQPSGVLVAGQNYEVNLAAQMLERLDTPRLQVLVEIFMVTVSRGFSRQLENILTRATDPGAGGNNIAEAELLRSISSAVTGGYTVNLSTATAQIQSAFSFLETHQLGRVLSSPTILVQDGTEQARIRRQTTAEVLLSQNIFDNSSRVIDTEDVNTQLEAPLELLLRDIRVFPAYQTVRMKVEITNKEFVTPLNSISRQEDADFTEDLIQTEFTASPGDVIVLAGLTNSKDSTSTTGIPGTTTLPGGLAGILGGSDRQNNQTQEMVVFLVPTVINPAGQHQHVSQHAPSQP